MANSKYTFLPWLRRGISNHLTNPVNQSRATLDIALSVNNDDATAVSQKVQLVGPGDVTGVNSKAVIRTEPKNWITNFEPNYLPFVEFYDEDFPWRYTPASPDIVAHRLKPWLYLAVLKETEFTRTTIPGKPSASILIKKSAIKVTFVDPAQTWAWAHVHMNDEIVNTAGNLSEAQINTVSEKLNTNPDSCISRLIGPRRLEKETAYFAFLIPAFEIGRLNGLGLTVAPNADALQMAWNNNPSDDIEFPVYYEWFFRTGVGGDFEYLVRLLKPVAADPQVGKRPIDIQQPGFGTSPITEPKTALMEGALLAPVSESSSNNSLPSTADVIRFHNEVQHLLNLQQDLINQNLSTKVITPPLYAKWHKEIDTIDFSNNNMPWINLVNKDPRQRATAGLGAEVVRQHQEEYMEEAWKQVGEVVAANKKIGLLELFIQLNTSFLTKNFSTQTATTFLQLTRQIHRKVKGSPVTIANLLSKSKTTSAAASPAFRKMLRPRGVFMKKLDAKSEDLSKNILELLNEGMATAAGKKPEANRLISNEAISSQAPKLLPAVVWILKYKWWLLIVLLVFLLAAFVISGFVLAITLTAAGIAGAAIIQKYNRQQQNVELMEAALSDNAVSKTIVFTSSPKANFAVSAPGTPNTTIISGNSDSPEAAKLRTALTEFTKIADTPKISFIEAPKFEIENARKKLNAALAPEFSFQQRWKKIIKVNNAPLEQIKPVMAYPDIKLAMYKPLSDLSSEYLIPNLKLIAQNSVTLLETNEPFIESYMLGLNQEFAGELLWREYPTDQRGSYFRQFWDPALVSNGALSAEELADQQKDIKRIHEWLKRSEPGSHNNKTSSSEKQLVLCIRGELLKRYPNTIIYAQKARWQDGKNVLELDDSGGEGPDDANIRHPQFGANIDPDLSFIGFNLTMEEAMGNVKAETAAEKARLGNQHLGWFFVLREVPGEPRFGLDESDNDHPPRATKWDDLSWQHLTNTAPLDATTAPNAAVAGTVQWGRNAADMATILYQKPVMVAIHARTMLQNS
ncbi:MAG: hypothetical protein U0T73_02550 [Chitinophagales bacterium]